MWKETMQKWIDQPDLDERVRKDLIGKSNQELEDMFYTSLEFGTGGMRGIIGAGTNRLNIYTIRRANDGLARYLQTRFPKEAYERGVVIAHDNRLMSREFAKESAKVLAYYGFKTYLFPALRPTPELSFAVRKLHALAGIVVTASHNPPMYNGYKIYDEFGCQYTPEYADVIVKMVNEVEDVFSIPYLDEETLVSENKLTILDETMDDAYLDMVKSIQIHPDQKKTIKVVFTPLHGTSALLGERLLKETGYHVIPVSEQMIPDPYFSTVKSPNPENKEAFEYAITLGKQTGADLLIATDPDADRLGIAVKHQGEYVLLTGNQTGAILIHYLLTQKKLQNQLPKHGVVFNTIVTSDLGGKIARSFGLKVSSTLTGFKFIGEQARLLEQTDEEFVFGYEESYGYVINDEVRDKDSLQALLFAAEVCQYYQNTEQITLVEKLEQIYQEYGYYVEDLHNINLQGILGKKRIDNIMTYFRNHPLQKVEQHQVVLLEDYETSIQTDLSSTKPISLPKSNVIKYILDNDSWFVLRPSGTEPKLKIYVGGKGTSYENTKTMVDDISKFVLKIIDQIE